MYFEFDCLTTSSLCFLDENKQKRLRHIDTMHFDRALIRLRLLWNLHIYIQFLSIYQNVERRKNRNGFFHFKSDKLTSTVQWSILLTETLD